MSRWKLTDPWFEAEFIGCVKPTGSFRRLGQSIEGAQGLLLLSPCGYGEPAGVHCVLILFANPRGAPQLPVDFEPRYRWQLTGSGLHDLTLAPSVDCTADGPAAVEAKAAAGMKPGECRPGRRCWHGFIQDGEVLGG